MVEGEGGRLLLRALRETVLRQPYRVHGKWATRAALSREGKGGFARKRGESEHSTARMLHLGLENVYFPRSLYSRCVYQTPKLFPCVRS